MSTDAIMHAYSPGQSLRRDQEAALRGALLSPASTHLRTILTFVEQPRGSNERDRDTIIQAVKTARSEEPHAFLSEAAERLAIATARWDLARDEEEKRFYFNLKHILELPASIYKPLEPQFAAHEIDRMLVAHTLMAESVAVRTALASFWKYYEPAVVVPEDVRQEPEQAALYGSLITRLEAADARTRAGDKTAAFVDGHYGLLKALRAATGTQSPSPAAQARAKAQADWAERRAAQVNSLSPEWRPLFERLIDLSPTDQNLDGIPAWPEFKAVMRLDPGRRGTILHELVQLAFERDRQRDSRSPIACHFLLGRISVFARDNPHPDFKHSVWEALNRFAHHLAHEPIDLDDRRMADVLKALMTWRDLCQFSMLDAAEAVLARGTAPRTRAALAEVARQPSHCIIPGPNARFTPHEGDVWWNGAPPRIAEMLKRWPGGPTGLIGRLFGRKNS